MFYLPNDILLNIFESLDIISILRLRLACKEMKSTVDYLRTVTHNPIYYINNKNNISCKYTNLNYMINEIYNEIDINFTCRSYTMRNHTLNIEKATRYFKNKPITIYSFTIKNNYNYVKILYDYSKKIYILRKKNKFIIVPFLFMFIGYKILFEAHGIHNIYGLNTCPKWFIKLLYTKSYNGNLVYDLVNNLIEI